MNHIVCRTLLDLRPRVDKYLSQTLLLAASWHRHAVPASVLEVRTIGEPTPELRRFLGTLGIGHCEARTGPNDGFSKSSNKIEAAFPDQAGRRVLLIDNDVCFVGSIDGLADVPQRAIAASEAGTMRITPEQWALIRESLRLPVAERRYDPINARPGVEPAGLSIPPRFQERELYLNSGVVLFPSGYDPRATWWEHQARIREFFDHDPCGSDAVTSSDQAGFATCVAAYGEFAWLPVRYNYRHGCFRLGLACADDISIVHLTGDVDVGNEAPLSTRVDAYWSKFIAPKLERLPNELPHDERARRIDIARDVLRRVQAIVREYDLDTMLRACRESMTGALVS